MWGGERSGAHGAAMLDDTRELVPRAGGAGAGEVRRDVEVEVEGHPLFSCSATGKLPQNPSQLIGPAHPTRTP